MNRVPRTIVHYALNDPRVARGGVETFGRTLASMFDEVLFMTPATRDEHLVRERRLPVICDNQFVLDWPEDIPVIGFQHGVGFEKLLALKQRDLVGLAWRQARAAKRRNTLWVACARWVSERFGRLHGNGAAHVIRYPVDLGRFDGRLDNAGSRLVLHDGRTPHKGSLVYPGIARAFPEYRFEPLDVPPERVAERMQSACAFVHLSRYEGNSVVCNEAMAMNLPCLFTRVGLALDREELDVASVPYEWVYGPFAGLRSRRLLGRVRTFLESIATRRYAPRGWVEKNASLPVAQARWADAIADFDRLPWA